LSLIVGEARVLSRLTDALVYYSIQGDCVMPILLPAISRRKFMGASAAAGLGLLLSRRAFAAGEPDPNRLFLISDTHIAAKTDTVSKEVNMFNNLKQVCGELVEADGKPAAVLHCGDCAYLN